MCTVGFKKGFKLYNKGVNYEKEISVLKNGSKYVRLEQNLHKKVSTKWLPDTKDISGVPVDTDFRLLRPKKAQVALWTAWLKEKQIAGIFYCPSLHFFILFPISKGLFT